MKGYLKAISIFAVALFGFFAFGGHAQASGNVVGFAWSDNIGWISMNCDNSPVTVPAGYDLNTCPSGGSGVDYGVSVDASGNMSGYGWSDNIGWVSFGPLHTPTPTQTPTPTNPANINTGGSPVVQGSGPGFHDVQGWIRFCSDLNSGTLPDDCGLNGSSTTYNGGWNGWVSMKGEISSNGDPYSVRYDGDKCEFDGFAWGGTISSLGSEVIGWISFAGVRKDNCDPTLPYIPIVRLDGNTPVATGAQTSIDYDWMNADADPLHKPMRCYAFNDRMYDPVTDVLYPNPTNIISPGWDAATFEDLIGNTAGLPVPVALINTAPGINTITNFTDITYFLDCATIPDPVTGYVTHAADSDPSRQNMECNTATLTSAKNTCPQTKVIITPPPIYTPVIQLTASPNPTTYGGNTTITYQWMNPDTIPGHQFSNCFALSDNPNQIGPGGTQPGDPGTWDFDTFFDPQMPNPPGSTGIPFPTGSPQTQDIGPMNNTTLVYLLCRTVGGDALDPLVAPNAIDPVSSGTTCDVYNPTASCPRVKVTVGNPPGLVLEGQGTLSFNNWSSNFGVLVTPSIQENIHLRWTSTSQYTNCVGLMAPNSSPAFPWAGTLPGDLNAANSFYNSTISTAQSGVTVPDDPTRYQIMCTSSITGLQEFSNIVTVYKIYQPGTLTIEGRLSGSGNAWQTNFSVDPTDKIELRWKGIGSLSNCQAITTSGVVTNWADGSTVANLVQNSTMAVQHTLTPFNAIQQDINVPNDPTTYNVSCISSVLNTTVTAPIPVVVGYTAPGTLTLEGKPAGSPASSYSQAFTVFNGDKIDLSWSAPNGYTNCVARTVTNPVNTSVPGWIGVKAPLVQASVSTSTPYKEEQLSVNTPITVPTNTTTYIINCKRGAVSIDSNPVIVGWTPVLPGDIILGARITGSGNAYTPAFPVNAGQTIEMKWFAGEAFNNCQAQTPSGGPLNGNTYGDVVGWQNGSTKPNLNGPSFTAVQNNPAIEVPEDPTSYFVSCDAANGSGNKTSNEVKIIQFAPTGGLDLVGKVDGAANSTYSTAFQINQGENITLEWSSTVAWTSCTSTSTPDMAGWNTGSTQTEPTSPLYTENKVGVEATAMTNTYTITCINNQGSRTSNSVVVTINPSSAVEVVLMIKLNQDVASTGTYGDFQSPNQSVQVPFGDKVSLHWESSDPVVPGSCTASALPTNIPPYWSGAVGDANTAPVTWNNGVGGVEAVQVNLDTTDFATTTYQVTCDILKNGSVITVSDTATATALEQNANAPSAHIYGPSCVKTDVVTFDLDWTADNLQNGTCTFTTNVGGIGLWDGTRSINSNSVSSTITIPSINGTTNFTLSCTAPNGTTVSETHPVTITGPACPDAPRRNWFFRFFER